MKYEDKACKMKEVQTSDQTFSACQLDKVVKLWEEMCRVSVQPTVISYGALVKTFYLMQQINLTAFSFQRDAGVAK
jgi:pentatricopeptide repeat protein